MTAVKHRSGKPTKITRAVIDKVIEGRAKGLGIRHALRRADITLSVPHWNQSLGKYPALLAYYEQQEALILEQLLTEMRECKDKQWTARAWVLERVWKDIYGQRHDPSVNVQVNTLLGFSDEIAKRARCFIDRKPVKQLADG